MRLFMQDARGPSTTLEEVLMFPFPSPLDFLRAFALAFFAGSAAGMGFVVLAMVLLFSFKRPDRFWRNV